MKPLSLYIHIPFCVKKCYYCDFVSAPNTDEYISTYVDAVISELNLKSKLYADYVIKTIFVGGGTPSRMKCGELTRIIDTVHKFYNTHIDEFTVEVNPGTFDINHIKEYKSLNVNRISVGVQSFNEKELNAIGRAISPTDSMTALALAGMYFKNVNADIIIGLPYQTVQSLIDNLHKLFQKNVTHISCYGLILEQKTLLYDMVKRGEVKVPDDDSVANIYRIATDVMAANGYDRYEISNFAREGYFCKHNLVYWYRGDYLGIGVAAHSLLGSKRFANTDDTQTYIEKLSMNTLPIDEVCGLSVADKKSEAIMLALRCSEGLDILKFNNEFNSDILLEYKEKLKKLEPYLLISENKISIKPEFLYVSNSIISDLM